MNARTKFLSHLHNYSLSASYPIMSARVAILGLQDYDALFLEISTSMADFLSCDQSQVSLELQRQGVAHFYYRGILVIRSPGSIEGFHFA